MTDRIIPACEDFGPIAARLREIEEAKRAELGKPDPERAARGRLLWI